MQQQLGCLPPQSWAPHLNGAVSETDLAISLDSALAGAINAPRPLASSASSWVVKGRCLRLPNRAGRMMLYRGIDELPSSRQRLACVICFCVQARMILDDGWRRGT